MNVPYATCGVPAITPGKLYVIAKSMLFCAPFNLEFEKEIPFLLLCYEVVEGNWEWDKVKLSVLQGEKVITDLYVRSPFWDRDIVEYAEQ